MPGEQIAAAVAAGGTVVDDGYAPSLTMIDGHYGKNGVVRVNVSAARKN